MLSLSIANATGVQLVTFFPFFSFQLSVFPSVFLSISLTVHTVRYRSQSSCLSTYFVNRERAVWHCGMLQSRSETTRYSLRR